MAHQQDAGADVAPAVQSTEDAMAALANEIIEEHREDAEEIESANDADEEYTEELSEGEEGEQEVEPEPVIEAPVSLTAEEKEEFGQLPSEAQDYVTRLETRRNTQVQQATTKAAEAQRQAEAQAANAQQEAEARFAQQLGQFASALAPQMPDPTRYADIQAYQRDKLNYDYAKAQHDELVQQVSQVGIETPEQQQQRIAQRNQELMQIPEIANEETREQSIEAAFDAAQALGYDQQAIAQSAQALDVKALVQVSKWKAGFEELASIKAKAKERTRDPKTGKYKRTVRPGPAQRMNSSGKQRAFEQAKEKLRQTGKGQDAQAAFKALIT